METEKIHTKKMTLYVGNTIYFISPIKEQNKQFQARKIWKKDEFKGFKFKEVPFNYETYFKHELNNKAQLFNSLPDESGFKQSFIKFIK